MEFFVRQLSGRPDTIVVRYDCVCGCKPNAEYKQGSEGVEFEHCCCGNVHFVGQSARAELETYLAGRKASGEPDDIKRKGYTIYEQKVKAPWGETVPVAYALPLRPSKHAAHSH